MDKSIERCACGWKCNFMCVRYGERQNCLAFFIQKPKVDKKDKKRKPREGGEEPRRQRDTKR